MKLELIPGGKPERVTIEAIAFEPVSEPVPVDAIAFEEDTFLVLSADPVIRPVREDPLRLLTGILELVPNEPGAVMVHAGRPPRILAVVHDLARDPTTRLEWVREAYRGIFAEAKRAGFRRLSVPLLGTVHGRLPKDGVVRELIAAVPEAKAAGVTHVFVLVAEGEIDATIALLDQASTSPASSTTP